VYRAWATANEFARQGWRVTVLTVPREVFMMSTGVDLSLERTIEPGIEVVRIPFESPTYANNIRTWSRWRAVAPELWNGFTSRRARRDFPESKYGGWRSEVESAAVRIHEKDPVDLVIGTANPNVDFVAGLALWEAAKVPYVMDYRDAWQLDVFSGDRLSARGSREDDWERRLITNAHRVWFVNEPILDWHAGEYPEQADRFRVVANGFDQDIEIAPRDAGLPRKSLTFGYIGTISGHVPVNELVAGWELAAQRSELIANSSIELYGYLDHAGATNPMVVKAMESFERNRISYRGPVAKGDIAATYARFDAVLLVLGTGKYVTSGKVYEYAATGLPIGAIHDPGNAASSVLEGSPVWRPARSLKAEDIADTLIATAELAANQTDAEREQARAWAAQYRRSNQLGPQIAELAAEVGA
jgi:glycosyltransferase involved in cell wall biosynthesis